MAARRAYIARRVEAQRRAGATEVGRSASGGLECRGKAGRGRASARLGRGRAGRIPAAPGAARRATPRVAAVGRVCSARVSEGRPQAESELGGDEANQRARARASTQGEGSGGDGDAAGAPKKADALWGDEDASTESKNDDESST